MNDLKEALEKIIAVPVGYHAAAQMEGIARAALAAQPPAAPVETGDYADPISTEEYFRGTLKVIAHWAEVDLSGEWETGLRGVIRSITDAAREILSAHPEGKSPPRSSAETGEAK